MRPSHRILIGHVIGELTRLDDESVHCVVTSPPYFGLRSYGTEPQVWGGNRDCRHEWGAQQFKYGGGGQPGEKVRWQHTGEGVKGHAPADAGKLCALCGAWIGHLGLESALNLYLDHLVEVMRSVRRVLRKDGTFWLNIGDSYGGSWGAQSPLPTGPLRDAGLKPKDLMLIPFRLVIRLQEDGWWVRSAIVWAKRAPMPESVEDRPTSSWEPVFLLTKSEQYFYDGEAVKEKSGGIFRDFDGLRDNRTLVPGSGPQNIRCGNSDDGKRNMRNVWHLDPSPFPEAHFATFPPEVPRRAILAGTSDRGVCPKCGAPWKRIVIKSRTRDGEPLIGGWPMNEGGQRLPASGIRHGRVERKSETTGWRPTCTCEAGEPVPATILDPFLGAGTSLVVADRLGRNCVGIELSPKYAAIAERRLTRDAGPLVRGDVAVEAGPVIPT